MGFDASNTKTMAAHRTMYVLVYLTVAKNLSNKKIYEQATALLFEGVVDTKLATFGKVGSHLFRGIDAAGRMLAGEGYVCVDRTGSTHPSFFVGEIWSR